MIYFKRRVREGESEPELRWDSLKVSDTVLKSRLGGKLRIFFLK
jgi:hypothetical protein